MDIIKKLAFKYADKALFALLALLLACAAINSPMFGDAFRPLREVLGPITNFFSGSSVEQFNQAKLQEEVKRLSQQIEDRLKDSRPDPYPKLTQVEQLKSAPWAATELHPHEWYAASDIFEQVVTITATVPAPLTLSDAMLKESRVLVPKGAEFLQVTVKGPRELELLGKSEGKAELEWRDTANGRHVQPVNILPFVPVAIVPPPSNLKAALEGASVRLVWDPPKEIEPRVTRTKYNVYRRKAEESERKKLATVPVSQGKTEGEGAAAAGAAPKGGGAYTDNLVDFDTRYVYVVTSVAPNAPQSPESKPCEPADIEMPGDSDFFVKGVIERGDIRNASFKVYKLMEKEGKEKEPKEKEWKPRNFPGQTPGMSIGGVYTPFGRGAKPVDYSTGATLVDVDGSASRPRLLILAKPAGIQGGVMVMVDEVRITPDTYRGKVVYLDKHGELKEKWMGKEDLDDLNKRFPGIIAGGAPAPAAPPPGGVIGAPPPPKEEGKPEELKPTTVR